MKQTSERIVFPCRRILALLLMAVMLLAAAGCGAQTEAPGKADSPPGTSAPAEPAVADATAEGDASAPRVIVDMEGTSVTLPEKLEKVVCIQPTLTEYIIAFGQGDKLVGTHKNALNKVWLQRIWPEISDLRPYSYTASAEDVLAVGADLVIVPNGEAAEPLRAADIPTVVVALNDIESDYQHIRLMGEIFGEDMAARIEAWIEDVEEVKAEINAGLDKAGITEGPSVYMVNGQSDHGIFYPQGGGGSALEAYLNGIRGILALKDFPANGNMPSEEEILATDPEVILIGGRYGIPLKEAVLQDPVWADVSAIRSGQVYNVPIGGIGWDQGYIALPVELKFWANVLYPEVFQYDLTEEILTFYQKYFDCALTEQEATYMIEGLTPEGTPSWED